jgi:multimeric flavodoxin WrbA
MWMTRILVINGSHRDDGITDQAVEVAVKALHARGAEVETILLREYPIEFCLNCRECTQKEGVTPGECVHHDSMSALVEKIEQSDGYILASPTNIGTVTAIFKRFMERLIVYALWPWGMHVPHLRKAHAPRKKALLISSCAAPALLGRWLFNTHKQLKMAAKTIGADTVGVIFTGLVADQPHHHLPEKTHDKIKVLAGKLLGNA